MSLTWEEAKKKLVDGCPKCDFDEASGALMNHCSTCLFDIVQTLHQLICQEGWRLVQVAEKLDPNSTSRAAFSRLERRLDLCEALLQRLVYQGGTLPLGTTSTSRPRSKRPGSGGGA